MYTVKIVENTRSNSMYANEVCREKYHAVGLDPEIIYYDNPQMDIVAKVLSADTEIEVLRHQSAYLVNEHGKTLKIINRILD